MRRVLVCGSNGLLGQRLALMFGHESEYEVLHTSHHRSFILDRQMFDYTQLDITSKGDVKSLVGSYRPDIIVNAAAMANVDRCELEKELAWKTNVIGVENLVDASRRIGAKLIHISTDYVFDGRTGLYKEEDRVHPLNYYGKSKLAGENVILAGGLPYAILRTILIYGAGIQVHNNFGLWVVTNLQAGKNIRCVDDQISKPTYVGDLAAAVLKVIQRSSCGIFHICGAEQLSRYDFSMCAADVFGLDQSLIVKAKSIQLQQKAVRPLITGFSTLKAEQELHYRPLSVRQGLEAMKREMMNITVN
jgi:dTDP-4-dehydrorhamnose reductase